MSPNGPSCPDKSTVMDIWSIRHPRYARIMATFIILVLALTGSQSIATDTAPRPPQTWAKLFLSEPVLAASILASNLPRFTRPLPDDIEPVVQVPVGLTAKQARNLWKKTGSPLPESLAKEAPYAGAARDSVVDVARNFIGTPYVFTGTTPNGFDCSGYVRFIYAHFGVLLPHGVRDQAAAGTRIKKQQAQPGDLVIWNDGSHSAIYAGAGRILHAPRPGETVSEVDLYTDRVYYVRLAVGLSD